MPTITASIPEHAEWVKTSILNLNIPNNFERTVSPHLGGRDFSHKSPADFPGFLIFVLFLIVVDSRFQESTQTVAFREFLKLTDVPMPHAARRLPQEQQGRMQQPHQSHWAQANLHEQVKYRPQPQARVVQNGGFIF